MGTAELFIETAEVDDFVRETLLDDSLYSIGGDGREIGLCPYVSFYIPNEPDEYLSLVDRMMAIYREFESSMIDLPFSLVWCDRVQDWLAVGDARLALVEHQRDAIQQMDELRTYLIGATERTSVAASSRWAFHGAVGDGQSFAYSELKLTFRNKWYQRNKHVWQGFVLTCIERLNPDQCYSGFEVGNGGFNFLGAYECDVLERICADHFYGMDIDHPGKMGFHNFGEEESLSLATILGAGIRTPTWCFLLSPYWQTRLGKTAAQIRAELDDPRIEITAIPYRAGRLNPDGLPALWIRLGELDLYPVDQGVPDLLVRANALIRPIRCDELHLLTLDPWDDDPNPRFGYQSSLDWMRRFDEDSTWPSPDRRKPGSSPSGSQGQGGDERSPAGNAVA